MRRFGFDWQPMGFVLCQGCVRHLIASNRPPGSRFLHEAREGIPQEEILIIGFAFKSFSSFPVTKETKTFKHVIIFTSSESEHHLPVFICCEVICICLWRIKTHHGCSDPVPLFLMQRVLVYPLRPEVTCTQVWSLEQSVTVVTRSRRPMLQRVNATWSVKERRAICVEEPTDCPSIGWSWARSQHVAVSRTLGNGGKNVLWGPHTLSATGLECLTCFFTMQTLCLSKGDVKSVQETKRVWTSIVTWI